MKQTTIFDAISAPAKRAQEALKKRIKSDPAERATLIETIKGKDVWDTLVNPKSLDFSSSSQNRLWMRHGSTEWKLHPHALSQMCTRVNVPIHYVRFLLKDCESWGAQLAAENLDDLFHYTDFRNRLEQTFPRFLVRSVGDEARGFVSRRFAIHIATNPLGHEFVEYCRFMQAEPADYTLTDLRLNVKCLLSTVFEPIPGQFLAIGMSLTNSDFGASQLTLSHSYTDLLRDTNGIFRQGAFGSDRPELFRRIHLGPALEDSDLNLKTANERTKEVSGLIFDEVKNALSTENVNHFLEAIKEANGQKMSWTKLHGQLKNRLTQGELKKIIELHAAPDRDLPPRPIENGVAIPTRWWAASSVAWLARFEEDKDRAVELQHEAGRFLQKDI